jgi:hypothetical protein
VHDGERQAARVERLAREVEQDCAVLPAGEQQNGTLELGRDLADHVDCLRFEGA